MSGFVARAACHGRRPTAFATIVVHERPSLSTRLLKERDVARFIVAPDGFGKTSLAIEYAETMFSWTHTFWVNAKSPCFLRDLDDGDMAAACLTCDEAAALVVFDDVPQLDPRRMEAFSKVLDDLLEAQCEVVVTCLPTCDISNGLQRDRIRIGASELLLDDAELDAARPADERVRRPASQIGPSGRVPALVWDSGDAAEFAFAKASFSEDMPTDRLLALATALVLREGACSAAIASGLLGAHVLAELERDYPHLGIDEGSDRFESPSLAPDALAAPFKRCMPDLVARSPFESSDALVHAWADLLVASGEGARACDIVRILCPRRKRSAWLLGHVRRLVSQACFFPMLRLACDRDGSKGDERVRLSAIEALCRLILGDEESALVCAKRHAFDAAAPIDTRATSLLVAMRIGAGSLASRVSESLQAIASAGDPPASKSGIDFTVLARACCAADSDPRELAAYWNGLLEAGTGETELCLCASLLFGLVGEHDQALAASPELRACERYVQGRLRAYDETELDYFVASAGLSLEEAYGRGVHFSGSPIGTGSLIQLRRVEMSVLAQRRMLEEQVRVSRLRKAGASSQPVAYPGQPDLAIAFQPKANVPVLDIRLFGHFEARLGGVPFEPRRFTRHSAQTLFSVLVVNRGRELSREALERSLWPQSADEVAHKNFYAVWSNLRAALTLPDGTCPYLVRHQYGCRIEPRYVHSDVERLSEICRELLFGVPNVDKWSALFAEVDRDFSSELLPAERKNRLIVQARDECRTRLVDALVAATTSVIDIDNPQWGVWFARAAIAQDETREDAYVALMRAQIAVNQRTAAMMTYLKCRRVLADRLGIDPSPETTYLYESLLDTD